MQISFVLAKNCTSANCTSKQTNKTNMNMLNLVETKTILIMILSFCKFSFSNSLGNCIEGCMCPLKGLVHCTMPCSPSPPPPPPPLLRLVYKGLIFCKDKQYWYQNKRKHKHVFPWEEPNLLNVDFPSLSIQKP